MRAGLILLAAVGSVRADPRQVSAGSAANSGKQADPRGKDHRGVRAEEGALRTESRILTPRATGCSKRGRLRASAIPSSPVSTATTPHSKWWKSGRCIRIDLKPCPRPDDALRAALKKQEPLLGDNIPATPQVLNRYNAAIRQFFDGKVEATGELNSRYRAHGDRIPPGRRGCPHCRGQVHRQPGNADRSSAPEAFEGRGGHSL